MRHGSTIETEHTGSPSLTKRILELSNLKLAIAGHIHRARGIYPINKCTFCNVSIVDEKYRVANKPMVIKYTKESVTVVDF